MLLSAANIAQAQQDSGEQASPVLEEIIVSGIRGSLKKSIDTKRYADSIVDAISAEDIGKFPDKNVADSLARITGVSVTRGFGEGEKIAVRGTSPSQNRTLFNGSAVASADWFVLDNPSRAFNYTLLPSTVVSSLEVYKSPQADIQEGSLGGTVYLRTRRPLEMDANSGTVQVQASYSENSEEWDPMVSGLYSWKNEAETFGLLVSATKQDRAVQREGTEVLGWEQQSVAGQDVWAPRAIGDAHFEQERERETFLVTAQWAPDEKQNLVVNYLNSELKANNSNYNNYVWIKDQLGQGVTIDNATINNGAAVAGEVSGNYAEYNLIDRVSSSETESFDIDYTYEADNFIFTAKLGTTEAEGGTESDKQYYFDRILDGTSYSGLDFTAFYEDGVDLTDGGVETDDVLVTRGVGYIQENVRIMKDSEDYMGFDFEFLQDGGFFTSFKAGLYYRDHDKSQDTNGNRFHWLADSQHEDGVTGYGDGDTSNWSRWLYGDQDLGTLADYATNGDAPYPLMNISAAQNAIFPAEAYAFPTTNFAFLPETWDVNEEILSAYFKADFETGPVRGNMGVRVVQTDVKSTGYNWNGDWVAASINQIGDYSLLASAVQGESGYDYDVRKETIKHDYTEILPNLNLAIDVSDDALVRISAARVMARPDYITIANQEGANLDTGSGSRGNPQLDPETANQFDVAYEWYFDDEALLSATWFYKDIQGSVINSLSTETRFNSKLGQNVQVDFSNPENGRGAEVSGIELGYQQVFGNFGLQANYTYTDADSLDDRDEFNSPGSGLVAGVSDHLFNFSGYYENNLVSARLSYNYRTQYYDGVSEFGSELYIDDYGQWDMTVTVAATESIDVIFEGVNITDEELEYFHIDESRASRVYSNGARFVVGVNYNF
jgi:iron complex outermembrane receptor protein